MEITSDRVKVYNPVQMREGVYYSKIMVDSEELKLQVPKNKLVLNKEKNKCSLVISSDETRDLIKELSNIIIQKTCESGMDWFGKELTREDCEQIYKEALVDDILYCFYDENTNFYTSKRVEIDPSELDDEINGIALIKCNMVIFTKTSFFTRWEIPQFKIKEDKKKNEETLLTEYLIKDLEEDDVSLDDPKDIIPNFQDITLF